jgi:hypothetical protein
MIFIAILMDAQCGRGDLLPESHPHDITKLAPCSNADLPWEYSAATGLLAIDVRPAGDEPLVTIAW